MKQQSLFLPSADLKCKTGESKSFSFLEYGFWPSGTPYWKNLYARTSFGGMGWRDSCLYFHIKQELWCLSAGEETRIIIFCVYENQVCGKERGKRVVLSMRSCVYYGKSQMRHYVVFFPVSREAGTRKKDGLTLVRLKFIGIFSSPLICSHFICYKEWKNQERHNQEKEQWTFTSLAR